MRITIMSDNSEWQDRNEREVMDLLARLRTDARRGIHAGEAAPAAPIYEAREGLRRELAAIREEFQRELRGLGETAHALKDQNAALQSQLASLRRDLSAASSFPSSPARAISPDARRGNL